MVYCLGASVVIIGALFKIMHFPGAGPLLMLGMCTEALLFAIGCLDKPHVDFHWQNVFPQLIGYGADPKELEELASKPRPTLLSSGSEAGESKKANVPSLSDKDFDALKGSITDLANTASQLSELGKIAEKTNKLSEKMDAAGVAADKFIGSQEGITTASVAFAKNLETSGVTLTKNLDASGAALNEKVNAAATNFSKGVETACSTLNKSIDTVAATMGQQNTALTEAYAGVITEMKKAVNGSKEYDKQVTVINQKLTTLNSVYELQINAIQAQAKALDNQTAQLNGLNSEVQKIQAATTEAAKAGAEYEAASKQLSKQVADLNHIYGNMLTALK